MKLSVCVIEARNLVAMDLNGFSDPYVKLQLGKCRFKTKVVKKSLNPSWNEEFNFHVEDLNEELTISVLDEDKYFNDDLLGSLKVSVSAVLDAPQKKLGPSWYPLQPKSKKSKSKVSGDIRLFLSLSTGTVMDQIPFVSTNGHATHTETSTITEDSESLLSDDPLKGSALTKKDKKHTQCFTQRFTQLFPGKNISSTSLAGGAPEMASESTSTNISSENIATAQQFDEYMKHLQLGDTAEIPSTLSGGVLLDQSYVIRSDELNSLLFAPGSKFMESFQECKGTTDIQEGSWTVEDGENNLKRTIRYTNAATKLIKAVKATEEQTYLKADGASFTILASVYTPDVPYGTHFRTELLFCITPGPELQSGDASAHLLITWCMNFMQSTMMRGMIESGARQGLKENFAQFAALLAQHVKLIDLKGIESDKGQVLASLHMEQPSVLKLAIQYFGNFTVISAFSIGLYVISHIILAMPSTPQGLEFDGLDLPDSLGEIVVCGILVLQMKRMLDMAAHFMQARMQQGSDHGVKAQGDGWLITIALIEGMNIATVEATGSSDPYVVFTCGNKTRTSSIKFQAQDPQWNEIFEFDAMAEPPSTMLVEVFDFDGPFDEPVSLGHAEINFVRSTLSELADIWIPLEGKLAQACQSKLHLRIFLNNTKGSDTINEYLVKMEKEVGKKINRRSLQTNSAFQKLFGLPQEEFLINDFVCHLKRKLPMQGRLFLSPRIIGFHSNLFGHKIKFFFLWEDIEEISMLPPSFASVGSPSLVILLRQGRGLEARHGAKSQDEEGRLKFHFQSFASFPIANRTIMALWRARSLSPEQKVQMVEDEPDLKNLQAEETSSSPGGEDVGLSEVYSAHLPITNNGLVELFNGGYLEHKVMEKLGCLDYSCTPWELVKHGMCQRQICYKFDKRVSSYGGTVTSTQQKSPIPEGWIVEEVMTLQGIPLADYFTLQLKYQIEDHPSSRASDVQVFLGIQWLRSTRHQKRTTKNVLLNVAERLKEMFSLVEKELLQ